MTKEQQIRLSAQAVNMYMKKYPKTGVVDMLSVAICINEEIERYGEFAERNLNTIIDDIHEKFTNESPSLFDVIGMPKVYTTFKQPETKPEEKLPSMEDVSNAKKPCRCAAQKTQQNQKTWVSDTAENKIIKILVPGVKKENIVLTINDLPEDKCVLTMKLKDVVIENSFVNPDMCAQFTLDALCDIDNLKASLELGILTIEIPKLKEIDTSRTIEIK